GSGTELRCPSSPFAFSEKFNELLGGDTSGSGKLPTHLVYRLSDGSCADFTGTGESGATFSPARGAYIAKYFVEKGYATNYAASWYLGRTDVATVAGDGAAVVATGSSGTNAWFPESGTCKGLGNAIGPMTISRLDAATPPTSQIPLLGDSSPGDAGEAVLTTEIPGWAPAGDRLCEAANDGPAYIYTGGTNPPDVVFLDNAVKSGKNGYVGAGGLNLYGSAGTPAFSNDVYPSPNDLGGAGAYAHTNSTTPSDWNTLYGGDDGLLWLQDTRDWYAMHSGQVNILMGDGSVKSFKDTNGDHFFNPGFGMAGGTEEADGITGNAIEMPVFEIYNGATLYHSNLKKEAFE
ncbi:MAG: DUF1559 domain-containing protein, partial [Planctomycetaceae bacterium]|nr:DUF1559 domain-containing protein [Planctomycetaceae bacterium]